MPPRRSHNKSRGGCLQCKQAHVKCKEDGSPCERCRIRGTTCGFASQTPLTSRSNISTTAKTKREASPSSTAQRNGIGTSVKIPETEAVPLIPNGESAPQTLESPPSPIFPPTTHLLELQLMHRWTCHTYKSLVTPAAHDDYVWQTLTPTWSLSHDFLLNGVLALTAYEIASCYPDPTDRARRDQYVTAATRYQGDALAQFQQYLKGNGTDPDRETYEPILAFSLGLMVLALASAQFMPLSHRDDRCGGGGHGPMVQNTLTHYELVRGCATVLGGHAEEYILSNPYIAKLTRFEDLPTAQMEGRHKVVIGKLGELNERRLVTNSLEERYEVRARHVRAFEACKKAIGLLQECFAKVGGHMRKGDEGEGEYQGYVLGWLNLSGEGFVEVIREGDQVAVLVLMVWGSLVEGLGRRVWWAKGFGGRLVAEIAAGYVSGEEDREGGRVDMKEMEREERQEEEGELGRDIVEAAVEMVREAGYVGKCRMV